MSNLDNSVRNFGYKDYSDYLNSEQWQNFRQKYRESGRPQHCLHCNNPKYQLHHITYKRICRETLDDVIPLCDNCHKKEHERKTAEFVGALKKKDRKFLNRTDKNKRCWTKPKKKKKRRRHVFTSDQIPKPRPCMICGKPNSKGLCKDCKSE